MATSATNYTNPTPDHRPTGDLEYLFRQRLGEAEVPPRLQLWEQLDHDLLVQQNDAYRRRLVVYRWLAAACVLLVLGVGGWAGLRHLSVPGAGSSELATQSDALPQTTKQQATAATSSVEDLNTEGAAGGHGATPADLRAALASAGTYDQSGSADDEAMMKMLQEPGVGRRADRSLPYGSQAFATAEFYPATTLAASRFSADPLSELAMRAVRLAGGRGYHRPDTLKAALQAAPPMLLATMQAAPSEQEKPDVPAKRWRFGGSHAVTSFNPNINFSQAGTSPSSYALANSTNFSADNRGSAYEMAAAEYRRNLQAGVGQRASLTAAVAPTKHWVLTAGVEVAEYRAASETSFALADPAAAAFTGKTTAAYAYSNAADFALAQPAAAYSTKSRMTNYRYQTVGVPVSARYGSNKNGLSLYAKVGAAVDLLLGSRVEVADAASATREYSLGSQDSPYRKVVAVVRGGGGVQYRPAGATWSLLVGPTAEAGLTTLNRDPAQQLLSRSRPYAVGLEASVEFGGGPATAHARH